MAGEYNKWPGRILAVFLAAGGNVALAADDSYSEDSDDAVAEEAPLMPDEELAIVLSVSYAVYSSSEEIEKETVELLDQGANPPSWAIDNAVAAGVSVPVLEELVNRGAPVPEDVIKKNTNKNLSADVADFLHRKGASLDFTSEEKELALSNGNPDFLEYWRTQSIQESGQDPMDPKTYKGQNPVMKTALSGNPDAVDYIRQDFNDKTFETAADGSVISHWLIDGSIDEASSILKKGTLKDLDPQKMVKTIAYLYDLYGGGHGLQIQQIQKDEDGITRLLRHGGGYVAKMACRGRKTARQLRR